MEMIFGGLSRENRAGCVEMSSYCRTVCAALGLSQPVFFASKSFGITSNGYPPRDRSGGPGMFRDADGDMVVVVHGDIVNRDELERELRTVQPPGRRGRWSLPELVWNLYRSFGLDFASKLEGVANIAIWHEREERLVLIPDPFGLRPFYYYTDGSTFLFASSIKAILQHPTVSRAVEPDTLHEFLALGFVLPSDTLFRGIKIVSAGDYLECANVARVRPLPARTADCLAEGDEDRMAEEYLELLHHAVSSRVRGTDRVTVLLSGGVDSSAVVSLLRAVGIEEIVTYSMHLDGEDGREREAARDVSRRFATRHVEVTQLDPTALNNLPEVVWQLEIPRVEVVAEDALCRAVDCAPSPVLTGDGNDIPWGLLSPVFVATSGKTLVDLYRLLRQRMTDESLSAILPGSSAAPLRLAGRIATLSRDTGNAFRDLISLDRRLFGAHFVNRMLGKLRIENRRVTFRFPYLDHRVTAFVASLPDHVKVRRTESGNVIWKYLFKKSLETRSVLPGSIIHRKKTWMHHPTASWLRHESGARLEQLVLQTGQETMRYFDAGCVRQLWREHREGTADHTHALESVLAFLVWHRMFIESNRCARPGVPLMEMF